MAHAHDQIYLLGFDHTPARLGLAEAAIESLAGCVPARVKRISLWPFISIGDISITIALVMNSKPHSSSCLIICSPFYSPATSTGVRVAGKNPRRICNALWNSIRKIYWSFNSSLNYENLRRYDDMAALLDRALALAPDQIAIRVQRATVDLNWHADPKPLHSVIDWILAERPDSIPAQADQWLYLALCENDPVTAARALARLPAGGYNRDGIPFPLAWCEGLVARARGDTEGARHFFTRARVEVDKIVRQQPNYAKALCALGMIDAALGRKKEAIEERAEGPSNSCRLRRTQSMERCSSSIWPSSMRGAARQMQPLAN